MYSQNGSSLSLDGKLRFHDDIPTLPALFALLQYLSLDAWKFTLAEIICLMGVTALAGIFRADLTSVGWIGFVLAHLPIHIPSAWNYASYDNKKLAV